jgi:hypothetical protein
MQAKYDAELELHRRKTLQYTVLRPGGLTEELAGGVEMGLTQIGKTRRVDSALINVTQHKKLTCPAWCSRELVAKVLLVAAQTPETEGLTIDVVDGSGTIEDELSKVVEGKLDAWTG